MKLKETYINFKAFFFDCDGVLWEESELLSGAKKLIDYLKNHNYEVRFLSNNSTKTLDECVQKFKSFDLAISKDQIITSVQVTIQYINEQDKNINSVYIIGEFGLISSFSEAGYKIASDNTPLDEIDAVIVGMDRDFNYKKLSKGLQAILNGSRYIATGMDPQFPTPQGILPGAGSMVSALSTASDQGPEMICGKPNPLMASIMLERLDLDPKEVVMIGDRVSTDLECALSAKINPVLVKTGFGVKEFRQFPNFPYYSVIDSLNDLFED